ncbi:hypothetical protein TRICHSKD4_2761 [Roseibium sp. TrichSKD4]|uniref:hypothetical protein n=1 Tax=Roseibium sp. TrichSKD4 TaxID=744980 RepID=UPI0001E57075|nr:hypothetical protein [Roseibium sp. TrichSKD4]EFO31674.1 hypothetical protein TRICHSKD4_2761 [Roseibium sp. TrichSKD4]
MARKPRTSRRSKPAAETETKLDQKVEAPETETAAETVDAASETTPEPEAGSKPETVSSRQAGDADGEGQTSEDKAPEGKKTKEETSEEKEADDSSDEKAADAGEQQKAPPEDEQLQNQSEEGEKTRDVLPLCHVRRDGVLHPPGKPLEVTRAQFNELKAAKAVEGTFDA